MKSIMQHLVETFIKDRFRNSVTCDMKLVATIVNGFKIWFWCYIGQGS